MGRKYSVVAIAALAALAPASSSIRSVAMAGNIIKADNADALNLTTSWTGGVVPGAGDVGVWDSTVTGANTTALGADLSWQGIRVSNPGGAVTISAGNSLTLGAAGIDMSAAATTLALNNAVALAANQTWNVADATGNSNADLTVGGVVSGSFGITKTGSGTLNLTSANTYTGGTTISAGTVTIGNTTALGTGTITFGDANTGSGNVALLWTPTAGAQSVTNSIVVTSQGTGTVTIGTTNNSQTNQNYSGAVLLNRPTILSSGTTDRLNFIGGISGPVGTLTVAATNNGRVVFTGTANSFLGNLTVNSGTTLQLGVANAVINAIPDTSSVMVTGTMNLSYTGSGTETMDALNGTGAVGINAGVTDTLILGSAGGSGSFSGVISGAANMAITKTGAGTQTLSGNSTYTGATAVNGGTLNLTGTLTSPITVNSTAVLCGTGSTTGSITLNGGSAIVASAPGSNAVQGATVVVNSVTSVYVAGVPSGSLQTVDVVRYLGTTPGTANFSPAAFYRSGALTDTGTKITLTYNAAARTWSGASASWDIFTTTSFSEGDKLFYWGDSTTFNEPAAPNTVTLAGNLAPSSVSVTNTTNSYTFSGAGAIVGPATLTKTGAGALVISTNNTYFGGSTISAGTVRVGSNFALGAGTVTLSGGATLASDSATARSLANWTNIAGPVTFGDATGTGALTLTGMTDLGGATQTITVATGVTATLTGLISNGGISKAGPGTLIINRDTNAFGGGASVSAGVLQVLSSTTAGAKYGLGPGTLSATGGGTLNFKTGSTSSAQSYANNITLNASTLKLEDGVVTYSGTLGLTGSNTIDVVWAGKNATFTNSITGGGGFSLTSSSSGTTAAILILNGNNSYSGATTISKGTLQIGGTTSGTSSVTLGSATAAALTVNGSLTTPGNLALGSGAVGNAFTVGTGATVTAASISNPWQTTYTINGALTTAGSWTISTNAASAINGSAGGSISAGSLSIANAGTIVNYSSAGTMTISGNAILAATTTGTKQFNQSAGTINFNSSAANAVQITSIGTNTYTLSGGTLNVLNTVTDLTFGGSTTGTLSITAGTANLKGVELAPSSSATGTLTVTGGRLNVGSGGITNTSGSATSAINLGAGTIGAFADWSSSRGMNLTSATPGVTVNTLDSADNTTARSVTLSGALTGVGSIVKSGSGTLSITSSGSNYTGSTTVSAGNLLVSGLLSGTTGLNVNGGSFSLGSSNRVNDAAAVSFGGGTLATAGFSETMGTATVAANSTLDLGSGASVVQFGDSSTATWTGGALLSITHWDGITAGGGTDQVYFGTSNAALTASQIAAIQFIDPAGFAPGTYSSQILPTGEVVPAPEPATASLLAATGLLLGLRRRRR